MDIKKAVESLCATPDQYYDVGQFIVKEYERVCQQNAYLIAALKNTDEMLLPAFHSLMVTNIFGLRTKIKAHIFKATEGE